MYRYMIRGAAFTQQDLDAILDLIVGGLTRRDDIEEKRGSTSSTTR